MVFAIGLAVVTAIAPASSVVTAPLITKIGSGAVGAAAGTVAGVATGAAGAAAGAATAGTATAGAIAIKASAGVTGGVLAGANIAMGPPGWIVLGKSEYSWNCWKKIIHDESDNEKGVPLSYIFGHENVKSVSNHENHYDVENVWGEKFNIYFVKLPNGNIAAHAE